MVYQWNYSKYHRKDGGIPVELQKIQLEFLWKDYAIRSGITVNSTGKTLVYHWNSTVKIGIPVGSQ